MSLRGVEDYFNKINWIISNIYSSVYELCFCLLKSSIYMLLIVIKFVNKISASATTTVSIFGFVVKDVFVLLFDGRMLFFLLKFCLRRLWVEFKSFFVMLFRLSSKLFVGFSTFVVVFDERIFGCSKSKVGIMNMMRFLYVVLMNLNIFFKFFIVNVMSVVKMMNVNVCVVWRVIGVCFGAYIF